MSPGGRPRGESSDFSLRPAPRPANSGRGSAAGESMRYFSSRRYRALPAWTARAALAGGLYCGTPNQDFAEDAGWNCSSASRA
jgi:hypothetical protein